MRRDIVWDWLDRPGLEHLTLEAGPDGVVAAGRATFGLADAPGGAPPKTPRDPIVDLRYRIVADAAWKVRRAIVEIRRAGHRRGVDITRGTDGSWRVDGQPRADLGDCDDVDLMGSPFTNTLPLRRFRLWPGERRADRVVYVTLPDLDVRPVDQSYERLDVGGPPRLFRYRNVESGFTADLTVDDDLVVTDYPGLWHLRSTGIATAAARRQGLPAATEPADLFPAVLWGSQACAGAACR
jgi:hypothetical protein